MCPEPRGIESSNQKLSDLSMQNMAQDIADVMNQRAEGKKQL